MGSRPTLIALLAWAPPALIAPFAAQDEPSPIAAQVEAAAAALQAIVDVPDGERTYENTLLAVDDVQARMFVDTRMTGFMAQVSTDPAERALGRRVSAEVSNWFDELYQREDVYRALVAYDARGPDLEGAARRYLDVLLRDYRRAGMDLAPEQREELLAIERQLTELGIEFNRNISEDESYVVLTPEECVGVPERILGELPRSAELHVVELRGPAPFAFFDYCEVEATRRKLSVGYGRRGGRRNVDVLERMIRLRAQKARLLGYRDIASYVTETRMAKDPATVWAFYDELRPKLRRKALQDFAELQGAKRVHLRDSEATLNAWDTGFYQDWLLREKYAVDTQLVREYLPLEAVIEGLFGVAQELFGLRFVEVTERARAAGRPLWHADVKLYEVREGSSRELLGEFYTDLHPRPGKYSHAAQFPLRVRKRWADGSLTRPLVALVTNFTRPTADAPALLSHDEVETFFHEFGHCLHSILSEVDLYEFSGAAVARDFVEAPSQMLENWMWDPEVLGRFARHYETGEPLPEEVIEGMIAARNLGSGLSTEAQVFLGVMDMTYHTDADGELDTTAVRREVYRETRLFPPVENVWGQASFGHLVGYEAGYYGYLWSLVYAQDMFSRFEADGIMNPELARDYRQKVLARGGTADALELVRDFLGREPSSDAFMRHLGLGPPQERGH